MSADLLLSACERGGTRYAALLAGGGRGQAVVSGSAELELAGAAEAGEDTIAVVGDAGAVSAEFEPAGESIALPLVAGSEVVAEPVATRIASPHGSFTGLGLLWRLGTGADAAGVVRALWVAVDGRLLVAVAARGADASEHGEEEVSAALLGGDAGVIRYPRPLLSTEYDAEGSQLRATLELWPAEDPGGLPDRGGGQRLGGGRVRGEHGRLEAARIEWVLEGERGFGGYEIVVA